MDIKKSLVVFGGLSLSLAGAALFAYLKELSSKVDDSKMLNELQNFLISIEDYFRVNNDRS